MFYNGPSKPGPLQNFSYWAVLTLLFLGVVAGVWYAESFPIALIAGIFVGGLGFPIAYAKRPLVTVK